MAHQSPPTPSTPAGAPDGQIPAYLEQILIATKRVAVSKTNTPYTDCADRAEIQAVILFPALGTPYVAPAEEGRIKLYLLVEDNCVAGPNYFLMRDSGGVRNAPLAWYFINRHLRMTPFAEAHKTSAQIDGSGLYESEARAKQAIKVWYLGSHGSGAPDSGTWGSTLRDHEGRLIATLRPEAIDFFVKGEAACGPIEPAHKLHRMQADVSNRPLRHLFEVELATAGLRVSAQPDVAYSMAWFVRCVYARAKNARGEPALPGVSEWEHQDKLVYDFLAMMEARKQHLPGRFAFELAAIRHDALSAPAHDEAQRIKCYHPVILKSRATLRIGHLSDVHVNSRHFALAQSRAQVVPGISDAIGSKLTNSFIALRELFENLRARGADAIFITGDLIDFNHNFNPLKLKPGAPKDQWAQYDLSKHCTPARLSADGLYPRGLDDMLVYSLIKDAYLHHCPVFMITGNHEAYELPYGLSPRLGNFGIARTYEQTVEHYKKLQQDAPGAHDAHDAVIPARALALAGELDATLERLASPTGEGPERLIPDFVADAAHSARERLNPATQDEYDLDYTALANEGIPADHNLTVYEACMAYGPSAGQIVKAWNFVPANFDWFFMIFTPLADFCIDYGERLRLIGLDWGASEVMLNADMSAREAAASAASESPLLMLSPATLPVALGKAIGANLSGLPRADRSLSAAQQQLITEAVQGAPAYCRNILFTHFTLLNYDMSESFYAWHKGAATIRQSDRFIVADAVFNTYNRGSFSNHRRWLFDTHINRPGQNLHYTLSGHAHRAGAYGIDLSAGLQRACIRACEIPRPEDRAYVLHQQCFPRGADEQTRILVSSCGGPIGVQNLHEDTLGWDLRPPSATLLNPEQRGSDEFRRIVAHHYPQARPRLCVFLDYLVVIGKRPLVEWIGRYTDLSELVMRVRHLPQMLSFIRGMEIFASGKQKASFDRFRCTTTLNPKASDENGLTYTVRIQDPAGLMLKFEANEIVLVGLYFERYAFADHPLYAHYTLEDPWYFPIEMATSLISNPTITRVPGLFGEVPNFKEFKRRNFADYAFDALKV